MNPAINPEAINQFDALQEEGAPDFLIEVIDSFFSSSPERLEKLASLTQKADIVGAAKEAHALKSSARILGATTVGDLCQKMEDLGSAGSTNAAELREIFNSLNQALKAAFKELSQIKNQRTIKA
jgi:HPt (histidine-containing phosphotransfer) domain-containing protein